jgi:photosystem II stability/assembly factor-like uncharacterized protein
MRFQISDLRLLKMTRSCLLPSASCRLLPIFCSCFLLLLSAFVLPIPARAAWVKQDSSTFAWLHAVFFVDAQRGWAVGSKGALLRTEDGGAHWTLRARPTEDALQDVFFTDAQTGWIVCERSIYAPMRADEARGYLLKTTDGGASWRRVDVLKGADVDIVLARVRFADAAHGWVFGEMGALYATTDGGASWTRQRVPTRHLLLGASFLDAQKGWLSGGGLTLLKTADGGASWLESVVNAPASYAAQTQKGAGSSVSTPRGASSNAGPNASTLRLNAVYFTNAETGWAVGAGGAIFNTNDGGRTWNPQESGVKADLFDVKFLNTQEGWAVGSEGTQLHTNDGGRAWASEPRVTPHQLERLFFVGRTRGWAVGFGGTILSFKG